MLMTTFAEWKRRLMSPARLHSSRRPGRRHRRRWATTTQAVAGFRTTERLEDRTLLSAFGAEHILVSSNNAVAEFTDDGAFVQSFSVPFPGGRPATETTRDVAVGADGHAHVYNGTFEPFVSTLDPLTGTWEHDSHPGWDTVNNVSYGGMATLGDFVFATDMRTFGDTASELGGIVRFDTRDGSSVRSSDVTDFQDLTVGLDGQLYALGEPAFSQVRVVDPQTLTVERSVTLSVSSDYRGIAVNAEGDIFAASWNGTVYRFDSNGVLKDSFASGTSNLTDIDVAADGRLIVGGRFGVLIVTDESFADPRVFNVSSRETFVAFAESQVDTGDELGELHGTKFEDTDGDGTRDAGEGPLAGVTVYLDTNDNGTLDTGGAAEPDDFANGTDLTDAFAGVTLSVLDSANNRTGLKVRAGSDSLSSTGQKVFFEEGIPFWGAFRLRADFDQPVSTVSLDFISSSNTSLQVGTLAAYDAAGNLLATYDTAALPAGRVETMTLTRPTADIAYVVAYTKNLGFGRLDNLHFGTPEPSAVTDAAGQYAFTDLAPGEYVVREVVPENFEQTAPADGPDRLFATTFFGTHRVQELDPATGAVLHEFALPSPQASFTQGLAFAGGTLFYYENGSKILYELDADTGAVLDSTSLGSQLANRNIGGLAAMNGLVYMLDSTSVTAAPGLLAFDPATDQVVTTFPRLSGQAVEGGLAALPGEDLLVTASPANELLFLDPTTGTVRERVPFEATISNQTVSGLAVLGDEIYLTAGGRITDVIGRDGDLIRSFINPVESGGLAGGDGGDGAYHVTLAAGQTITGLDFGNRGVLGELHGTKFEDLDGDGTRGAGEGPLPGVTVYLDMNNNGELDGPAGGVEPDDFAPGAVLNTVNPAVTLSVLGSNNLPLGFPVTATTVSGTTNKVFGHANIPFMNDIRRLRMQFAEPVATVSIDFRGSSPLAGYVGRLEIYDAAGNLLDTYRTQPLLGGSVETMTLTRPDTEIAYAIAYSEGQTFGQLDNLRFGTPEPSTVTDADGQYAFTDLAPGEYVVREVVPEGYRQTSPGAEDDYFFAVDASRGQIVRIDAETGQVTRLGPHGVGLGLFGLVFTNDGELFGLQGRNAGNDDFYRVDPVTGHATFVGKTGRDAGFGLAYDNATDTIYGIGRHADGTNGLVVYDRATGLSTEIGQGVTGLTATSGVAFDEVHRRVIAFDNSDDQFYAFDLDGHATLLSRAQPGVQTFGLTFDGQTFVMQQRFDGSSRRLFNVDVDTGIRTERMVISEPLGAEALEFVETPDFAHVVTLDPGEVQTGLDFGNQRVVVEPVIDLNGDDPGIDYEASFTEDAGAVSIVDTDLSVEAPLVATTPDAIYVANSGSPGRIVRIDAETHEQTLVAAGGSLGGLRAIAAAPDGTLIVADASFPSEIIRIDPETGIQSVIASGGPVFSPQSLAVGADGTIFVGQSSSNSVIRIDPDTGATSVVKTGIGSVRAVALENDDTLLVGLGSRVSRLNVHTGALTTVTQFGNLQSVDGLAVADDGTIYAVDFDNQVIRIDPATGAQTLVTSRGLLNFDANHIAVASDGGLIVVDRGDGQVVRVDPVTGDQTLLADGGLLTTVQSVAVVAATGGDGLIDSAVVTITNLADAGQELLAVQTAGTAITADYDAATGVLTLTGADTAANYQRVLRTVTYENTSQDPDDSPRVIEFVVTSGGLTSDAATATVAVVPVNDAPVVTGLDLDAAVIDEGGTVQLTGTFADPEAADTHTVVIDWGDGQSDTIELTGGERGFSLSHRYDDDNPSGTASDSYRIAVTVRDDQGGVSGPPQLPGHAGHFYALTQQAGSWTDAEAEAVARGGHLVAVNDLAEQEFLNDTFLTGDLAERPVWIGLTDAAVEGTFVWSNGDPLTFTNWQGGEPNNFDAGEDYAAMNWHRSSDQADTVPPSPDDWTGTWNDVPLAGSPVQPNSPHGPGVLGPYFGIIELTSPPAGDTVTVTVNNVAPDVSLDPLAGIDEGGLVTLAGTFTDPGRLDTHSVLVEWDDASAAADSTFALGATASLSVGDIVASSTDDAVLTVTAIDAATGAVHFTVDGHRYLDDGPAPGNGTALDASTVTVTVGDDLGTDAASVGVTVSNVAPTVASVVSSSPGVGGAGESEPVTVSGTFADVGVLDRHAAVIDWGDGTQTPADIDESGGAGTFAGSHAYAQGGVFTITVTLSDDDLGVVTATATAVVSGVGVSDGVLYVIGTGQDDHVTINQQGNGRIHVHADFLPDRGGQRLIDGDGVTEIVVLLGGGDDDATIAGGVDLPVTMDGGAGNDHLNDGGGPNLIWGGTGDDTINGGGDRDILIGGDGADRIVGNGGEDILLAGATTFDPDGTNLTAGFADALQAMQAEWLSTGRTAAERAAGIALNAATVQSDDDDDALTGASGDDWFLAEQDEAGDLKARDEVFTDLAAFPEI